MYDKAIVKGKSVACILYISELRHTDRDSDMANRNQDAPHVRNRSDGRPWWTWDEPTKRAPELKPQLNFYYCRGDGHLESKGKREKQVLSGLHPEFLLLI